MTRSSRPRTATLRLAAIVLATTAAAGCPETPDRESICRRMASLCGETSRKGCVQDLRRLEATGAPGLLEQASSCAQKSRTCSEGWLCIARSGGASGAARPKGAPDSTGSESRAGAPPSSPASPASPVPRAAPTSPPVGARPGGARPPEDPEAAVARLRAQLDEKARQIGELILKQDLDRAELLMVDLFWVPGTSADRARDEQLSSQIEEKRRLLRSLLERRRGGGRAIVALHPDAGLPDAPRTPARRGP
jgi:hypothetical protein